MLARTAAGRAAGVLTENSCGPGVPSPVPVLVLTTFDLDDYVFGALEAGASGFLLEDADPVTIVTAVRQVAAGEGTLDRALTRRVLRELVDRHSLHPVTAGRASEVLTPCEHDILLLLAQRISNQDNAGALTVEVSTVKSHLVRLVPELGVRSRLQAVVRAYQSGVAVPRAADPSGGGRPATVRPAVARRPSRGPRLFTCVVDAAPVTTPGRPRRETAPADPVRARVRGRTDDLRYQVSAEDPQRARWPELKGRISTAGFDPGAA